MHFFRRIAPFFAALLFAAGAKANDMCGAVVNYRDVLTCAETKSPDVIKAEQAVELNKSSVKVSAQYLNPDLGLNSVAGSAQGKNISETDVSLAFPIELGGKRSARVQASEAELARAEQELRRQKAEVRRTVFLKLVRLRQITDELHLVEESTDTFSKLVKQYEGRPARSPEQEVSLSLFRLVKSDYIFKKMEYDEELSSLESFFKVTTGLSLDSVKKALPSKLKKWPMVKKSDGQFKGLASLYEADVNRARAELEKAKSEAWPTLKLGPSAKFTGEGNQNVQQWGGNLSLALPIFNANGAGKNVAAVALRSAENQKDLGLRALDAERNSLEMSYRKSIVALEDSSSEQSLEEKHKKVEGFFIKGLVSSALVIEAHRSIVDFEKTRNGRELRALDAYMGIQIIDGDNVELNL